MIRRQHGNRLELNLEQVIAPFDIVFNDSFLEDIFKKTPFFLLIRQQKFCPFCYSLVFFFIVDYWVQGSKFVIILFQLFFEKQDSHSKKIIWGRETFDSERWLNKSTFYH